MSRQKVLSLKSIIEDVSRSKMGNRGAKLLAKKILERIENEIVQGNSIHLGIGKLAKVLVNERKGVNPKTGEKVIIPAHYTVKFKISKTFKEKLKEIGA